MFNNFDIIDQLRSLTAAKAYTAPQYGINDYTDGFVIMIRKTFLRPNLTIGDREIRIAVVDPSNEYQQMLKDDGYVVFVNNWGNPTSCAFDFVRHICNTVQLYQTIDVNDIELYFETPFLYSSKFNSTYQFYVRNRINVFEMTNASLYVTGKIGNNVLFICDFTVDNYTCIIGDIVVHPGYSIDNIALINNIKSFIARNYKRPLTFRFFGV